MKHIIEGKVERIGRQGRRRKLLLNDVEEIRRYCNLKEEAIDRILCESRF